MSPPLTQVATRTHTCAPYATGPAPVYYGSGFVPRGDFWRLGALCGALFLASLLGVGLFTLR